MIGGQNVAVFGHLVVVCKPLLAVFIHCDVVHHRWEKDQDCDFAVLYNVNLKYDSITGHETRLVCACSTAVFSILQMLSLGIY